MIRLDLHQRDVGLGIRADQLAVANDAPISERDFQTWRLLNGPPTEYTRERFDDEYNWTVKWNMTVPGATYENTVDNRAWK